MLFGLVITTRPAFDPAAPEHRGAVLIRTRAFSCNYRDKALMLMAAGRDAPTSFYVIGSEFAGAVVAVGDEVERFAVGDRVMSDPFYDPGRGQAPQKGLDGLPSNHGSREYQIIRQEKVIKMPDGMPDAVGGAFSIGAQTTYSMIRKLGVEAGSNVLVTAARSNTSLFAINALKKYEVRVFALTTSTHFDEQFRALGVQEVIPVPPEVFCMENDEGRRALAAQLSRVADPIGGFNYVIDPFYNLYMEAAISALAFEGKYVSCGVRVYGNEPRNGALARVMERVMQRNVHIIGNCLGTRQDLCKALEDYTSGCLDVVLDSTFQGPDVASFVDRTYNARDRFGKVLYLYD